MATESAARWQEIIVPATPLDPWSWLAWGLVVLVLVMLLAWLGRWWWCRPRRAARRKLRAILRQLQDGALSPRAGLYAASASLAGQPLGEEAQQLLSRRFARQEPGADAVEKCLRDLQRGLAR